MPEPDRRLRPKVETQEEVLPALPWNVVLLDDDDHSYEYVIAMLGTIFHYPVEKSFPMAEEVDATGRVIVFTGAKEEAELHQEQIHSFGRDPLIPRCAGSMTAVIEPLLE
ncbi:MAG: ATP-dependent Clp protease adaptor ClpS [Planctomycetes bacterium]|nr:ATP-dependent Clp protease adaptor ClpS [Planctomycetota bacterium]